MGNDMFKAHRKSHIEIGKIYFWTATINKWQRLLMNNEYKQVILDSLTYLSEKNKIDVYGFVIMPNHVHFIWKIKSMNGKETAPGSFLKYTVHAFRRMLHTENKNNLALYAVNAANKEHEFWQRDTLVIHLFNEEMAYRKLDYIHANPCTDYWQLTPEPQDYFYSSAKYYEMEIKDFAFLKDLRDEF